MKANASTHIVSKKLSLCIPPVILVVCRFRKYTSVGEEHQIAVIEQLLQRSKVGVNSELLADLIVHLT